MKKILVIAFVLIPIINFAQIDLDSINESSAFKVGEELIYEVKYGLIKGGEAKMKIDLFQSGDDYLYHVKALAVTTGAASRFAKIYDIYESYFEISSGYPIKSIRNIRESNYIRYNEILFFREEGYVLSVNRGKVKVPKNTFDVLSAFYYARRHLFKQKISVGETIELTTYNEDKIIPITIKYVGTDKIRTDFGKIECLKFVPVLNEHTTFKKETDLQVWISNDDNYLPVKVKLKLPVGSVKANLIGFKNLKNDFGKK